MIHVRQRLSGLEHKDIGALSVAGQVKLLIKEAQDPSNLALMYYGWAAWV
jgi:phosphatidylinositol kinase/protein kinase (PI-3  family)